MFNLKRIVFLLSIVNISLIKYNKTKIIENESYFVEYFRFNGIKDFFTNFYQILLKKRKIYQEINLKLLLINDYKHLSKKEFVNLKKRIETFFKKEEIFNFKIITKIKIMKINKNINKRKIKNKNLESDSLSEIDESKKETFNFLKKFKNYFKNNKEIGKFDIKILFTKRINENINGISFEKGAFDYDYSYGVVFLDEFDKIKDIQTKTLHEIFHLLGASSDNIHGSLMNCFHETNDVKLSIKSKREIYKYLFKIKN